MRHGHYILDENNHPVEATIYEWAHWFEVTGNRIVGSTQITSEVLVSTVFLGIDHQWGDGPPILFETMIFGGEEDQYQKRYSSWDDAKTGHDALVKRLRARYLVKS